MSDRVELLEAALDSFPDGYAVMSTDGKVAVWNRAAAAITGHPAVELLGRPVREALDSVIVGGAQEWVTLTEAEVAPGRGSMVHLRHWLGHELPALVRLLVLRDGFGSRIGTAALFHLAERIDALPHGESQEGAAVESSQVEFEDRLEAEFADCVRSRVPFGVLWIAVDQAHELRRSHGARACEAMLEKVAHVLAHGLRPGEELGRWGDGEFLVICHERTAEMLTAHAQTLAGLARTTDFRWWGDRVSLSVSIGAAQAAGDMLAELLEGAQSAMRAAVHAGGNHVTHTLASRAAGRN